MTNKNIENDKKKNLRSISCMLVWRPGPIYIQKYFIIHYQKYDINGREHITL